MNVGNAWLLLIVCNGRQIVRNMGVALSLSSSGLGPFNRMTGVLRPRHTAPLGHAREYRHFVYNVKHAHAIACATCSDSYSCSRRRETEHEQDEEQEED